MYISKQGINVHTEDIIRDPLQMDRALKNELIVFCWGDDNNDQNTIKFLVDKGIHGIIYDKLVIVLLFICFWIYLFENETRFSRWNGFINKLMKNYSFPVSTQFWNYS